MGIEVAQSKDGLVIYKWEYVMDILKETSLLNAKPVDTPIDPSVKLLPNQREPLSDTERYIRLVVKLNHDTFKVIKIHKGGLCMPKILFISDIKTSEPEPHSESDIKTSNNSGKKVIKSKC